MATPRIAFVKYFAALGFAAGVALAGAVWPAGAQVPPVRLPVTVINAAPDPPGPRKIAGVVRDTSAAPIDQVELSIPSIDRRAFSRADGSFRFDDVPPGTYDVRARKVGFAPQIRPIVVDTSGGVGAFTLLPVPYSLQPVVSSAARGGLSGTVGDTAFRALADATIRIVGHSPQTRTDSLGQFFFDLQAGSYLVSVEREGYARRLVSVIIPADSGKRLTVFLSPARPIPVREAHNFDDLVQRMSWRTQRNSRVYTRADLEAMKIDWVYDAVNLAFGTLCNGAARSCRSDRDCSVVVNGGPRTMSLAALTVDEIETVEVYYSAGGPPQLVAPSRGRGSRAPPRMSAPPVPLTNTREAGMENGTKNCVTTYVWLR